MVKNRFTNFAVLKILNKKQFYYQLTCEDCKKSYIGKTTRNFCVRLNEHLSENKKNDSSVIKLELLNIFSNINKFIEMVF